MAHIFRTFSPLNSFSENDQYERRLEMPFGESACNSNSSSSNSNSSNGSILKSQMIVTIVPQLNHLGQSFSFVNLKAMRTKNMKNIRNLVGSIGIDWIPPMSADISIKPHQRILRSSREISKSTAVTPPDSFRWDQLSDVAIRFNCGSSNELPLSSYTRDPPDQGHCGSCWSFASAGMLGDRFRIWTQEEIEPLAPTVILACATKPNGNQCEGGNTSGAYDVCTQIGLLTESDAPYDSWCNGNACNSSKVPSCSSVTNDKSLTRYFAAETETHDSTVIVGTYNKDYAAIKEEIWQNGPVTTGYYVFADFYGPVDGAPQGASASLWDATGGVYMNGPNIYDYKYNGKPSFNQKMGAHMVVIIGWGTKEIPNIISPDFGDGNTTSVHYWIVRNSWGMQWNANNKSGQGAGLFLSAWAGTYKINGHSIDVNQNIGLDHLASNRFGGCWIFSPKVDQWTPVQCNQNPSPTPTPTPTPVPPTPPNPPTPVPPSPDDKKKKKKKGWLLQWQNLVDDLTECKNTNTSAPSECKGSCTWKNGQCLNATETLCSLVTEGAGQFHAGQSCFNDNISWILHEDETENNKKKNSNPPIKTSPCVFPDGSCIMTTRHVAKKIGGRFLPQFDDCKDASLYTKLVYLNNNKKNKKEPEPEPEPDDDDDDNTEEELMTAYLLRKKENSMPSKSASSFFSSVFVDPFSSLFMNSTSAAAAVTATETDDKNKKSPWMIMAYIMNFVLFLLMIIFVICGIVYFVKQNKKTSALEYSSSSS
jgi:hypothetical protein